MANHRPTEHVGRGVGKEEGGRRGGREEIGGSGERGSEWEGGE